MMTARVWMLHDARSWSLAPASSSDSDQQSPAQSCTVSSFHTEHSPTHEAWEEQSTLKPVRLVSGPLNNRLIILTGD